MKESIKESLLIARKRERKSKDYKDTIRVEKLIFQLMCLTDKTRAIEWRNNRRW